MSLTVQATAVIDAVDHTGGVFASLAKKFDQLGRGAKVSPQIDAMSKSLEKVRAQMAALDKVASQSERAAAARLRWQTESKAAKQAAEAMKALERPTKAMQRDFDMLSASTARADEALRRETIALHQAKRGLIELGIPTTKLAQEQERLTGHINRVTAAMEKQAGVEHRSAERRRRIGAGLATAGPVLLGASGALARAGAGIQHANVGLQQAGLGAPEIGTINDQALALSLRYKNVSQESLIDLAKEVRSIMTNPHEVQAIMPTLAAAKSVLDARDHSGEASHGLGLLVKGAENIGAAKDPERLAKLIDGYVKAMQVMGKTINPEGIFEFDKYSKLAGARFSDRFLMRTGLSLSQEMAGSTAGKASSQLNKQIGGGLQNLHTAAKEFAAVGLIDPANLDHTKTGEVKGVKAGVKHAVLGDMQAASDPDLWVYHTLLPHLEKAGMTSRDDQLAWVGKAFPNSNVSDLIGKLIVQRESYEAHANQFEHATGTAGADLNKADPIAGMQGLTTQLQTFAGVMASPAMAAAGQALDFLAGMVGKVTAGLADFQKAHPDAAPWLAGGAVAGTFGTGAVGVYALFDKLAGGFGLGASATALDASAGLLSEAAMALGAKNPLGLGGAAAAAAETGGVVAGGAAGVGAGEVAAASGLLTVLAAGGLLIKASHDAQLPGGGGPWAPATPDTMSGDRARLADMQQQLGALDDQIAGIRQRSRDPSAFNPTLTPLESQRADLANAIAALTASLRQVLPGAPGGKLPLLPSAMTGGTQTPVDVTGKVAADVKTTVDVRFKLDVPSGFGATKDFQSVVTKVGSTGPSMPGSMKASNGRSAYDP